VSIRFKWLATTLERWKVTTSNIIKMRLINNSLQIFKLQLIFDDDGDDEVDGVRLRLWTVATNGPIVHPSGDRWTWRNMAEWYRQRTTPDLSPELFGIPIRRIIWQQAGETGEGNVEFGLSKYFCSYLHVIFTCRKILPHWASGYYF
jgi:hypothetical protein